VSFTPLQQLIARLTLEAIADLGFALGGGQALHVHGYGDRLSRDLDFYIPQFEQDLFDRTEEATLAALRAHGYTAEVGHQARSAPDQSACTVQTFTGAAWRCHQP
jgi:hypothetical protein